MMNFQSTKQEKLHRIWSYENDQSYISEKQSTLKDAQVHFHGVSATDCGRQVKPFTMQIIKETVQNF